MHFSASYQLLIIAWLRKAIYGPGAVCSLAPRQGRRSHRAAYSRWEEADPTTTRDSGTAPFGRDHTEVLGTEPEAPRRRK